MSKTVILSVFHDLLSIFINLQYKNDPSLRLLSAGNIILRSGFILEDHSLTKQLSEIKVINLINEGGVIIFSVDLTDAYIFFLALSPVCTCVCIWSSEYLSEIITHIYFMFV